MSSLCLGDAMTFSDGHKLLRMHSALEAGYRNSGGLQASPQNNVSFKEVFNWHSIETTFPRRPGKAVSTLQRATTTLSLNTSGTPLDGKRESNERHKLQLV